MEFFDFLPDDAEITMLVIVGPYPSYAYISYLVEELNINKEKIFLIVDDAWNVEELKGDGFTIQKVCAETESGLVHAKMYFMKYYDHGQEHIQLVTGSANASFNGMKKNAENLSSYTFHKEDNAYDYIERYFTRLAKGKYVKKRTIRWRDKVLVLPDIKNSTSNQSFSSWLRSGILFYRYSSDSNFGVILIKLNKPLPMAVKWGKSGFGKDNFDNRYLKNKYLNKKGLVKEEKGKKDLTLAASIETNHGRWISKDHYNKIKNQLNQTNVLVECLDEMEKNPNSIVRKLLRKVNLLRKANQKNPKVLKCLAGIDEEYILNAVMGQIKKDKKKCDNKAFCIRYTSGYEPSSVPNLSSEDWEAFVESWFDFCMMKGDKKPGWQNPLAIRVKKLLMTSKMKERFSEIDAEEPYSSETLREWFLNNDWNLIKYKDGKTLKDKISRYFEKL